MTGDGWSPCRVCKEPRMLEQGCQPLADGLQSESNETEASIDQADTSVWKYVLVCMHIHRRYAGPLHRCMSR